MVYGDRPYVTERPDALRRLWETCPPSGIDRAAPPKWQLDRWKVLRDLITAWYTSEEADGASVPDLLEAHISWMDPVQQSIVERLFAGWRAMYPRDPDVQVDLDPDPALYVDHEAAVELRVSPTFDMEYPDGSLERIRLRTGRFGTGPDDAAVLAADDEVGAVFIDAFVAHGVAEEVELPSNATELLDELVTLANRDRRTSLSPGPHCFGCPSVARCGQYPLIEQGRVFVSTRSLVVSKSQLSWAGTCERRIAWDRVFAVPVNDDGELDLRSGLSAGRRFHETAAAALMSDDPASLIEAACRTVEPSEAADLRLLWDTHCSIMDQDGQPEVRATEYPAGFTLMVPGVHVDSRGRESQQPVAVTFIGILDATGREPEGIPMVIEHRTGQAGEHSHLEQELYAVSAAAALYRSTGSWPDELAVHLHHLRPESPTCSRRLFTRNELAAATEELRNVASMVASWHPYDSLSPSFTAGPWCDGCRHRPMCEGHR